MQKLLRSLKLYFIFIRYSAVGFSSFVIDVSAFAVVFWLTHNNFFSLLIGRVISGSFNFYFNKYVVYRSLSKSLTKREALSYLCLAVAIFVLSYTSITELSMRFHINVVVGKIAVDGCLFVVNFLVQKHLFKSGATIAQQEKQEQTHARNAY